MHRFCTIGDKIYSDMWPSYTNLSSIYVHQAVNHSQCFADPNDHNININRLEGTHSALRRKTLAHGPI